MTTKNATALVAAVWAFGIYMAIGETYLARVHSEAPIAANHSITQER